MKSPTCAKRGTRRENVLDSTSAKMPSSLNCTLFEKMIFCTSICKVFVSDFEYKKWVVEMEHKAWMIYGNKNRVSVVHSGKVIIIHNFCSNDNFQWHFQHEHCALSRTIHGNIFTNLQLLYGAKRAEHIK